MLRSRLTHALLLSVLVHAALFVWLQTRPAPPASNPQKAAELTLKWVDAVAPLPPLPPTQPAPAGAKRPLAAKPTAPATTAGPQAETPVLDVPRAEAAPPTRPLSLVPSLTLATGGDFAVEAHGETLRPDDPRFSPDVVRAEAEKRVGGRVKGMLEDELASARAERGLPHPYFSGLRSAGKSGLDQRAREAKIEARGVDVLASIGDRYLDASKSYGKSGNPDLGPPGTTPRVSEKLAQASNASELGALRMLAQATETQNDLSSGKPFLALQLELRQFKDGAVPIVRLMQRSHDAKFDAFVMGEWPKSIESAGPPPPDAFHGPELRSVWQIEGWVRLPKQVQDALSYAPVPGVMGLGADKIAAALGGVTYHYEFDAKLLRVY